MKNTDCYSDRYQEPREYRIKDNDKTVTRSWLTAFYTLRNPRNVPGSPGTFKMCFDGIYKMLTTYQKYVQSRQERDSSVFNIQYYYITRTIPMVAETWTAYAPGWTEDGYPIINLGPNQKIYFSIKRKMHIIIVEAFELIYESEIYKKALESNILDKNESRCLFLIDFDTSPWKNNTEESVIKRLKQIGLTYVPFLWENNIKTRQITIQTEESEKYTQERRAYQYAKNAIAMPYSYPGEKLNAFIKIEQFFGKMPDKELLQMMTKKEQELYGHDIGRWRRASYIPAFKKSNAQ